MDTVRIFDTTLRDGEQSPGATLTLPEKLEIARHLEAMGVDIIEAGFPDQLRRRLRIRPQPIAAEITREHRLRPGALHAQGHRARRRSGQARQSGRIHVFCATSQDPPRAQAAQGEGGDPQASASSRSSRRRQYTDDVEFCPEDASRTELEFLEEIVQAAVEAGATTINLPDTVGYATPKSYGEIFAHLLQQAARSCAEGHHPLAALPRRPGHGRRQFSLAAVENGARQVECTINGIGERAGNAALEEIVMALRTRGDYYKVGTRIDTTKIYPASRMVSTLTGLAVQRNKAIVGENAFAHEAGIHQDGMLKYRETYEIMDPATVGIPKNSLVLGKHSGRHAFRDRVTQLGYTLTDEQIEAAFVKFKALADKKKEVFDEDIEALVDDQLELTGEPVGAGRPAGDQRLEHDPDRHRHAARQHRRDGAGRQHRRRPGRRDLLRHPAADRHQGAA